MTSLLLPRIAAYTDQLLETARGLDDLTAPSLCPGWTRAHVLTHVARNADGLRRLVTAAVDGSDTTMYDSQETRDAEIEAGAGRDRDAILADLEQTAATINDDLARLQPVHDRTVLSRTPGGPRFLGADLPYLRLREVAYHHVDLGAGFGFGDLGDGDVVLLLDDERVRLAHHPDAPPVTVFTDEGERWAIGQGGPVVGGPRTAVLGWMARGLTDGIECDGGDLPSLPPGP